MAQILKPDYTYLWGQGGAVLTPSASKIQQGWTAEIPINQWENWAQNRQDQGIAYLFQRGIAEWDENTEYFADKSVTIFEGQLYIALTNNTNAQPDTSTGDWRSVIDADPLAPLAGMVVAFAMTTPPEGFLKANGAAVSRTTYARLFARIGTTFGAGNGTTTFNLPDARGEFIRGWADNRTDLDSGRAFGTTQTGNIQSHSHNGDTQSAGNHTHSGFTDTQGAHTHTVSLNVGTGGSGSITQGTNDMTFNYETSSAGAHQHNFNTGTAGSHFHSFTTESVGGSETRPHNLALLYCIKY